jgi:hypothetical protein
VIVAVVLGGLVVAGSVAVARSGGGSKASRAAGTSSPPAARLTGTLVCTARAECVYTIRNPNAETSYVSYGNTAFSWGMAHFAGGGCLAPGQSLREVAYTHDGHGNQLQPPVSLSRPFSLPYVPHDNRCR